MMLRWSMVGLIILGCSSTRAEYKPTPRAEKLPQFDVMCYRNYVTSFEENGNEQIMEPAYHNEARFRLFTVNGLTLKVVRNPQSDAFRDEWGVMAPEINISLIADPAKRPPFYGWRHKGSTNEVFSYHAGDKILTEVSISKGPVDRIISVEVLSCR
jgi:hypothetical protein